MKKVIRLTESDLTRIVRGVINEQKKLDCISQKELFDWLESVGYSEKKVYSGKGEITFMKKCGNAKSEITLMVNPVGCVLSIDQVQFVYKTDKEDNKSGQKVWDVKTEPHLNFDKAIDKIIYAVDYGYKKYKPMIQGCTKGFITGKG